MTRSIRRAILIAGAAAILASCSSDPSEPTKATTTTTVARRGSEEWQAAEDDPCTLLTDADVAAIFGAESPKDVELVDSPPDRSCRYRFDDTTVSIDLFRPMPESALEDRTRGGTEGPLPDTTEVRLVTQGKGVYVANGSAVAFVSARPDPGGEEPRPEVVTELVTRVSERLPDAPKPAKSNADACAVVPSASLELDAELLGGDPESAQACAYRTDDGTLFSIEIDPTSGSPVFDLSKPWNAVGEGATFDKVAYDGGGGGSVTGVAPFDEGSVQVAVSSPVVAADALSKVAAQAVKRALASG